MERALLRQEHGQARRAVAAVGRATADPAQTHAGEGRGEGPGGGRHDYVCAGRSRGRAQGQVFHDRKRGQGEPPAPPTPRFTASSSLPTCPPTKFHHSPPHHLPPTIYQFGYEGYEFNTNGLGAVLGLFHAIGIGDVGNLALNSNVRAISNIAASNFDFLKIPKTKSENAPVWWQQG